MGFGAKPRNFPSKRPCHRNCVIIEKILTQRRRGKKEFHREIFKALILLISAI